MVWLDQIKETVGLRKEEKPKFFWTVYLDSQKIALALVKFQEKETEVLETRTKTIEKTEDLSGLIEATRDLIGSVSFPQKPEEVFFGVPDFWFENDKLKEPHQKALKKLSQDLGLTFLGSVSTLKGILEFYRHQEGTSTSLIFLEILPQKIRVALCRQGQVESRSEKEQGDSVAASLQEALKEEFAGEGLPARIVVLGAEDFEKIRSEILDSSFEETGLFLHLPKVETFSAEELLTAIGLLAKGVLGERRLVTSGEQKKEEEKKKDTTKEDRFGFVVDKDISQKLEGIKVSPKEEILSSPPPPPGKEIKTSLALVVNKVLVQIRRLPLLFSRLDFSRLPRSGLLIGGIAALVLVGTFLAYWYLPKAKIILFVEPKDLKETLEVTLAPDGFEASESAKVLRGRLVAVDFSGELSAPATGTKLTGDKATGQVTIFNKTEGTKSFPQGTKIVGPNGLGFTLDQAVSLDPATIATASGSETKTYGQAEVGVTADDIGSEYNLPGGIDFSVGNFSSNLCSAYSPEGFSGGSSREVTVVSEEDQRGLEESLTEEFRQKAGEKITNQAGEELKVFPEAVGLEVKERRFDHDVGEEAETVSLAMEATVETLGFSPDSLKEWLAVEVAERVPEEFELIPGQIESQEEFLQESEEALIIKVNFQAHLLPKLDLAEIKKKIAGKKPAVAQDYLDELPRTAGAQITLWPPIPPFLWRLPHQVERISVGVRPE